VKELISWNPVSWNPGGWTRTGVAEGMLCYSDDDIHEPLTKLPLDMQGIAADKKQEIALSVFTVILQYLKTADSKPAKQVNRLPLVLCLCRNLFCCGVVSVCEAWSDVQICAQRTVLSSDGTNPFPARLDISACI
jgi:hypothetical protein